MADHIIITKFKILPNSIYSYVQKSKNIIKLPLREIFILSHPTHVSQFVHKRISESPLSHTNFLAQKPQAHLKLSILVQHVNYVQDSLI